VPSFIPRKKILALMAVLILAVAIAAGYYLWRVPLDITRYRGTIISRIEDVTGADITTGDASLRILPSPYLEVKNVRMTFRDEEVLKARVMKLHISILPIFLKKIVIERMTMEGWKLNARRRPDGTMALVDIYENVIKRKHIVSIKTMRLASGRLTLVDNMGGRDLRVKATFKRGQVERKDGVFRFQADLGLEDGASVFAHGEVGKSEKGIYLKGRATLANMDLAELSKYAKRPDLKGRASGDISFTYSDSLKLSGLVNYKDLTLNEPSLSAKPLHSGSGKAGFAISLVKKDLSLKIKKARLDMDDYVVKGSVDLAGDVTRPQDLSIDLNLESTPIPAREVKALVLDRVFKDKELRWINDFTSLGGAVSVKSFILKGTVNEISEGTAFKRTGAMRLEAGLEGLSFHHGALGPEEVRNLFGGFTLADGSLAFHGLSAKVGTGFIEKLSYSMKDLYTKKRPTSYDLSLAGHMDAGRAIKLTIRLFRDSGKDVKRQLRRIAATGDTRVKFNLKGKIDVKDSAWFSVNLGLSKATFRYEGFPLSFTSLDGNIEIDNNRFTFTDIAARDSANSTLRVNGYIRDYTGANPFFRLETRGSVYGGTLSAFTGGTVLEDLRTDDALSFTSRIEGQKKSLKVDAEADLGPTGLEYGKLIKKNVGVPLVLTMKLILKERAIEIKKASLRTVGTSLNLKGSFNRGDKRGPFSLFIESKKARIYDLADMTPLIVKRADTAGTLNVILKVSRGRRQRKPGYSGIISLKKGHFSSSLTEEPLKALDLFLDFEGDSAKLRIPTAKVGASDIHGSLEITSISKGLIKLNLASDNLDTSDIWGEGRDGLGQWLEKIRSLGGAKKRGKKVITGSGKISINRGTVLDEEVRDLKGEILMSPQFVRIDPIVFLTKGGAVKGMALLYRGDTGKLLFRGTAGLTGIDLKALLTRFGAKKDILTGTLNGDIAISCRRNAKPFARCLNGKIHVRAEKGRMWKFQVISKIFSIVNIISIDELFKKGLPYKSITSDFAIKDGVITTDDLLFDSDSMRMSAVMSLDSAEGTIDATLGVHPFVTIDKVVTNIPLVGWIIGGKEKSSVSLYYSIKGPLKKPAVEPARIKNIQKGIIGKMERLITSPIKIIEMGTGMLNNKDKGESDDRE